MTFHCQIPKYVENVDISLGNDYAMLQYNSLNVSRFNFKLTVLDIHTFD